MAKKQTRRSISINGPFYDQLITWLRANKPGMSASQFVEDLVYAATGLPQIDRQQANNFRKALRKIAGLEPAKPRIHKMDPKLVAALTAQSKPHPVERPCRAPRCRRIELHEAHE